MSIERRIVLVAFVGVIAVFFGLGATLPRSWDVETNQHLPAPPARVCERLRDFAQWKQWSTVVVTERADMQLAVEGPPGQVGHRLVWRTANNEAVLQLTRVDDDGVDYDFLSRLGNDQPLALQGHGSILVTADGDGSLARWRDHGLVDGFGARWFAWFGAQQDNARRLQEASLARLGQQLEGK